MQKLPSMITGSTVQLSMSGSNLAKLNPESFNEGEVLIARVISNSRAGVVKLLIGGREFEGVSAKELKPGQELLIKTVTKDGQLQLQIVSAVDTKGRSTAVQASIPDAEKGTLKIITPELLKGVVKGDLIRANVEARDGSTAVQGSSPDTEKGTLKIITPALLKGIVKGDLIQAKVVTNATDVTNNVKGQLSLKIGDVVVKVATALQPAKGQPLYLRAVRGGDSPILEQITHKEFNQHLKVSAYRQVLPRQQSLVVGLQKLLDAGQTKTDNLPLTIKESIATLVKQIPSPDKVSIPVELRQALANTGLFTESKLVAGLITRGDLKLELGQLISLIRPLLSSMSHGAKGGKPVGNPTATVVPSAQLQSQQSLLGELLRSSDSAMAKIQSLQLSSLPQEDTGQQSWHFELPILNGAQLEQLSVVIDQQSAGEQQEESTPWSITLQMNLSPLGAMRVELKLQDRTISTTFWAEEQQTLAILNENIDTLKDAFERAGLEVNGLRVLHGAIKPIKECIPDDLSLLNVKA